ncbi:hypothetical protein [Nannocystis punicea]|uniref:Lipoprotein n=1 Tax=Nannocystis punicea TaxID=2995304 RepID=A0ABY7GT23_9BACT|nr:hypothetical protein [Nannocystis poenicansa]WAS90105.1 hypothetical protein O0S08_28255 [Nannocystis poenicansa]
MLAPQQPPPKPRLAPLGLALLLLTCRSERAGADDCAVILDRIVALELAEQGYRDPELTRRKQQEFARRFAPELQRCEGLSLPPGARECIARAASAEEISHVCLR